MAEARAIVAEEARRLRPGSPRRLRLEQASGRWLAAAARAERDAPPWPRAMRDGYVLRAEDAERAQREGLRVRGLIRAGDAPWTGGGAESALAAGECVEIMTGAPAPPAAGRAPVAVAMVEFTRRDGERVFLQRAVAAGENIAPQASEMRAGAVALVAGARLDYSCIALLAAVGEARPRVYPPPRVAVLATGDELVEAEGPRPEGGQIRNSNGPALAVLVRRAGGRPWRLPPAGDDAQLLRERLRQAAAGAELVLVTGGASVGKFDFVQAAWRELGGTWRWNAVRIRPGKPVKLGVMAAADAGSKAARPRLCLALPGNPLSAMLTFELFAQPLIAALAGEGAGEGGRETAAGRTGERDAAGTGTADGLGDAAGVGAARKAMRAARPWLAARMGFAYRGKAIPLDQFLPVRLEGELTAAVIAPLAYHGSADMAALAAADAYLHLPPNTTELAAGEWAEVLLK